MLYTVFHVVYYLKNLPRFIRLAIYEMQQTLIINLETILQIISHVRKARARY